MCPLRNAAAAWLGLAALAVPAHALTTSHLSSDTAYLNLAPVLAFVAEGRVGDRGGAATFELDLGQETSAPAVQAQYDWQNSQAEPFSLTYDALSGGVTFALGGRTLSYAASGVLREVFVRTRAVNAGTSISVSSLVLDGVAVGDASAAIADGVDYLRIEGAGLSDGFTLTGVATMLWAGAAPTQSRLAFQIKVGTTDRHVGIESEAWEGVKRLYRTP